MSISKEQTQVPSGFSPLLDWCDDEYKTFFAWIYLTRLNSDMLDFEDKVKMGSSFTTHSSINFNDHFKLDKSPTSNNERQSLIFQFMQKMDHVFKINIQSQLQEVIRSQYSFYYSKINKFTWLKQNDEQTMWLWNKMEKSEHFEDSVISWFIPANAKERYIAITAALYMPHSNISMEFKSPNTVVLVVNDFLNKTKIAHKRKFNPFPAAKNDSQLNAIIPKDVKDKFDQMAKNKKMRKSDFMIELIMTEWRYQKSNRE